MLVNQAFNSSFTSRSETMKSFFIKISFRPHAYFRVLTLLFNYHQLDIKIFRSNLNVARLVQRIDLMQAYRSDF